MKALLAVILLGQCAGGVCLRTASAQVEGVGYYVIKDYPIHHEGMAFTVKGYMLPSGKVRWDQKDPRNAEAYATAKSIHQPIVRPIAPPVAGQAINFGVDPTKRKATSGYTAKSEEGRRFVEEVRAAPDLPKLHVTVIGSPEARSGVVQDLKAHPAFAQLRDGFYLQDYSPDEWPVDPALGFVTNGKPTIMIQTAKGTGDQSGGRVAFRAQDYSIGPEGLAEAIRKANPSYVPSQDPSPNSPDQLLSGCPLGFKREHMPFAVACLLLTLLIFTLPRKAS